MSRRSLVTFDGSADPIEELRREEGLLEEARELRTVELLRGALPGVAAHQHDGHLAAEASDGLDDLLAIEAEVTSFELNATIDESLFERPAS